MNTQSPRKLRIAKRIVATIRHEGSKWNLYTKDGSRKLGEHDTKKEALAQERAIHARTSGSKRVSALEYLIGFLQDQQEKWKNVLVDLSSLTGEAQDEAIKLTALKKGMPKEDLAEAVAQVGPEPEDTKLMHVAESLMASRTQKIKASGTDHDFRGLIGRVVSGKNACGPERLKGIVVGVNLSGRNYKIPTVWILTGTKELKALKTFGGSITFH